MLALVGDCVVFLEEGCHSILKGTQCHHWLGMDKIKILLVFQRVSNFWKRSKLLFDQAFKSDKIVNFLQL